MIRRVLICVCVLLAGTTITARAQDPAAGVCAPADPATAPLFGANTSTVGVIDLHLALVGPPVTYYECVGDRATRLGTSTLVNQTLTSLIGATAWRCDRLERFFAATATTADGHTERSTTSVETRSCAKRLSLTVPARVREGTPVTVRIADGWRLGGITTRLCLTRPDRRRSCRPVRFKPAVAFAERRFKADRKGTFRLDLQVRRFHVRATVAAGVKAPAAAPHPLLLATGDSTMQGLESALADDLGGYDVLPEVHPGYAIGNVDWPGIARDQTANHHQAVTVVSLGGAEGFGLTTADGTDHPCCDQAWSDEYTRRVRTIMDFYRRRGTAPVYYLTIPLPSDPARAAIIAVVNQAIVRAAQGVKGVTVLRPDLLFTPHGFQNTIRDGGRDVPVREIDGIHLNASGTAIEGREVARAIRGERSLLTAPSTRRL